MEPLEFLGVWIDKYGGDGSAATTLNLYWTARIVEGTLEPADDVAEFRWFAPGEISEDELAFPHTREVLSACGRSTRSACGWISKRSGVSSSAGSPSTAAGRRPARESTGSARRLLLPGPRQPTVGHVAVERTLVEALPLADREEVELVAVVRDEHHAGLNAAGRRSVTPSASGRRSRRPSAAQPRRASRRRRCFAPMHESRVEAERDVVQEQAR